MLFAVFLLVGNYCVYNIPTELPLTSTHSIYYRDSSTTFLHCCSRDHTVQLYKRSIEFQHFFNNWGKKGEKKLTHKSSVSVQARRIDKKIFYRRVPQLALQNAIFRTLHSYLER
jgi:hypothetical protein